MLLQEINHGRICLSSIGVEIKPMARLQHNISLESDRDIEVRRGFIDDTRTIAAANKKVVLAINHLYVRQQEIFRVNEKFIMYQSWSFEFSGVEEIVGRVIISIMADGALTDSAYLAALIS